jgi:Na+-translocating ferredoxin:NAD+ oxidoreductase subunit B
MTSEVVYEQLRDFLDRLPTGFPKTPTRVELKILRKLFSPEAATLTMQLSDQPESVADIASRTGIAGDVLAEKLESMA